jgi:hypothetical protein
MAEITASQGEDEIDNGTYPATLLGISVEESTAKSPNQKQWLRWLIVADDGSSEGVELYATSSYKCTARSKTRSWIEAVIGRQLKNGETVRLEDLKALDCFVLITHDEGGFARVENILPLPKRSAGKAAITPPPPPQTNGDDDGVAA